MMEVDLLGAVLAGAITTYLAGLFRNYLAAKRARARAAEEKFSAALQSDDLSTLATYLRDDLGAIPVGDYLADAAVRRDVDKYLGRLAAFVAAPAIGDSSHREPPEPEPTVAPQDPLDGTNPLFPRDDDPPPIVGALATLRDGDIWSALARLRREIEINLRALRERGPEQALGLGPAHESGRFSVTTDVPQDAAPNLRRFWRVASSAVHGQPVSMEEAVEAIADARAVYAAVDRALSRLGDDRDHVAPP